MKITIVTWCLSANYGTCLQAYSLYRYLCKTGNDVSICGRYENSGVKGYLKSFVLNFLPSLVRKYYHVWSYMNQGMTFAKANNLESFRQLYSENEPRTKRELEEIVKKTDLFITGSDQIWNTYYRFDPFMFLCFAANKRRAAYASSIGTSCFKNEYIQTAVTYLNRFEKISVRENSAKQYLNQLLEKKDVIQVLDPTFLLDKTDWERFSHQSKIITNKSRQYILCYLIGDNSYADIVKKISIKSKISNVIVVQSTENAGFKVEGCESVTSAGPIEFIDLILHSSLVCTDSFHASAISINLNKDFVVLKRFSDSDKSSQNSRLYDLLELFRLNTCLYNDQKSNFSVDYSIANKILKNEREKSENFLQELLMTN